MQLFFRLLTSHQSPRLFRVICPMLTAEFGMFCHLPPPTTIDAGLQLKVVFPNQQAIVFTFKN